MQPVTPENTTQKVGKIYFRLFALIYKGFKHFRPFKCRKQNVEIEMEIDCNSVMKATKHVGLL